MKRSELQRGIRQVVRSVVALVHPLKIILFGSTVTGMVGPNSDLDFLVLIPDGQDPNEITDRLNIGVRPRSMPCDFVVTTPSTLEKHRHTVGLIYSEILEHGKEVYVA
jgi:predicted nucleotidyltransferase